MLHVWQLSDVDGRSGGSPRQGSVVRVAEPASNRPGYGSGGGYQPAKRHRGSAAAGAMLIVACLLSSLIFLDVGGRTAREARHVLVVQVPLTPPAPPQTRVQPRRPAQARPPAVKAPRPIVIAVQAAPAITAAPPPAAISAPSPTGLAVSAPLTPAPAPLAVAQGEDLSARMIAAKPPSYPIEARRRRQEGVVVLSLLLSPAGSVVDIAVLQSSGFEVLDRAALAAVRRWRWAPLVQHGEAVQVSGQVTIPFVLRA